MAGQAERQIPRRGCEVTDFIRREALLCNVKYLPYGKREALACASMDVINYFLFCDHPPSLRELWRDKSGAKHTSLFLKKDGGLGEGKNFFSREKKFFPSPESDHFPNGIKKM